MTFISTYSGASIRGWQSVNTIKTYTESQELLPNPNIANVQYFGSVMSMSLDNSYLLVSQGGSNTAPRTTVYLYNNSLNLYEPKQEILGPADSSATNYNGSTAITGELDTTLTGAAHIYDRSGNTWTLQANIVPATGSTFGRTVDMNYWGNMVAIADGGSSAATSAVYTYYRSGNTWSLGQTITNPTGLPVFGDQIAITKDTNANYMAIKTQSIFGTSGKVCIYNKTGNTTYSLQQTISAPGGTTDSWPSSIAINDAGDVLAIGDIATPSFVAGKVYIYKRTANTWSLTSSIQSPNSSNYDYFGENVKLNGTGEVLLVTDTAYPIVGTTQTNKGIIYVFRQTASTYKSIQSITPNTIGNNYYFGRTIAMGTSGSIFAAGATDPGLYQGEVFIYTEIA